MSDQAAKPGMDFQTKDEESDSDGPEWNNLTAGYRLRTQHRKSQWYRYS